MRKAFALAAALLLTACAPDKPTHAHWREVCAESHMQLLMLPATNYDGTVTLQQQWLPQCDQYEWACAAGTDGSTRCEEPQPK